MAWKIRFVTLIFLLYDSIRLTLAPEKSFFLSPFALHFSFPFRKEKEKEKENVSGYCVDTPHLNPTLPSSPMIA